MALLTFPSVYLTPPAETYSRAVVSESGKDIITHRFDKTGIFPASSLDIVWGMVSKLGESKGSGCWILDLVHRSHSHR